MNTKDFFQTTLKVYKKGAKAVGWGSKKSQDLRFRIILGIGDFYHKSVLDFGCGTGDLFRYTMDWKYTGYDVVPEMIEESKRRFPGGNFTNELPTKKFDYVLASGVFNLAIPNWEKETYKTLKVMWELAKVGMAVNFLSSLSPKKDSRSYYASPDKMVKFFSTLTNNFTLRHDYKKNDMTFYLYKRQL